MVRHALLSDHCAAINRKGSHGRLAVASLLMSAAEKLSIWSLAALTLESPR
jgi:hypothetical protein